ncbi:unnamed protein product [Blepharisma stoltei]|uniref:Uncharacterized protein n=1 Tax=Blepharisma stoltei TaxID=1481888 RepID=A0AAU9IGD9_9CILI|nr:unnamed protein product [Blepharisma stoltei]
MMNKNNCWDKEGTYFYQHQPNCLYSAELWLTIDITQELIKIFNSTMFKFVSNSIMIPSSALLVLKRTRIAPKAQ